MRLPPQHGAERARGAVTGRDHGAECIIRTVLVLASRSPRRARLLREAGYLIDVVPADVDERRLEEEVPRTYVVRLAAASFILCMDQRAVQAAGGHGVGRTPTPWSRKPKAATSFRKLRQFR